MMMNQNKHYDVPFIDQVKTTLFIKRGYYLLLGFSRQSRGLIFSFTKKKLLGKSISFFQNLGYLSFLFPIRVSYTIGII